MHRPTPFEHTPADYARRRGFDVVREPVIELGMVHGIAGTLVALSALTARGRDDAAELAREGLRGAWARERLGSSRFARVDFGPAASDGALEFTDRRWCVGDHGVLRALWLTATTLGEDASAERALVLLRDNAARDVEGPLPGSPGRLDLCCGCSVIAQVYARMLDDTGEAVFRTARDRLLTACAAGVEGVEHPSFAYGRAGILLALLTPHADEDPLWDAMLGVSLPRTVGELTRRNA